MKRRLINAVCILLLLSSAVFLLMPHVSREITKKDMDDKISRFETAVSNTETLPDEDDETASDSQNSPSGEVYSEEGVTTPIDVKKLYEDSKEYNKALADHQDMGKGFTDSVLYLPDYGIYDGMYGYISCSAIGLYLPIYLGATDENMSYLFLTNMTAIEYIRNAMKRVRKKESSIILASQNNEDFLIPSIREFTKPLFSIPTHQFLFNAGQINPKEYMDALMVEPSEFELIKYPERGTCLYRCGNERYLLQVIAPDYKAAMFGKAGGR